MAKKTPAKKPRRRLKRSVRRSLSAVLMITAIIIAAIPVPENYADNGDAAAGSMSRVTDVHSTAVERDFIYDATGATMNSQAATWARTNLSKFVTKEELDEDAIWDAYDGPVGNKPQTYASMAIRQVDGVDTLSWQFMYYDVNLQGSGIGNGTRGVICMYNGEYMAENVELPIVLNTEYYTVERTVISNYFDGLTPDGSGEFNGGNVWTKGYVNINPDYEYIYTYNDYLYGFSDADDEYFFKTYFASEMASKENQFKEYEASFDEETGSYTADSSLKDSLVKMPKEIRDPSLQTKYYCEHDNKLRLQAQPYTLVSVQDQRPNSTGGTVYVAKGGEPTEGYYNDSDGYLVIARSDNLLCGIGDYAFKGNDRIQNLEIPSMISFIGDHAFEGASLIKEINIVNAPFIGSQAFKECGSLSKVTIGEGVNTIGAECFYHTAIDSITLPSTIQNIGYGAFAYCTKLTSINLNAISQSCEVADFAFYECSVLNDIKMESAQISTIGKGAFACTGGAELDFVFPKVMTSYSDSDKKINTIGDFMFAGRSNLRSVVFPEEYGKTATTSVELPPNMFHECSNLSYVVFPTVSNQYGCGYVSYDKEKMFADVANVKFYVQGPKMKNISEAADPRTTTWSAVMAIAGNPIPYLYIENGKEYYEVSNGIYLYCVDSEGYITSCTLTPDARDNLDDILKDKNEIALNILPEVGTTKVVGIATGCFTDDDLNQNVKSLVIPDNSLTEINNDVFKGWSKLSKVTIGNSVTTIGDRAFADCSSLVDVTFNSPTAGHEAFKIGQDAFKTGSAELTFHGDIVKGYAPFEWAMDPNNIIDSDKPDSQGIRVCYKSMSPYYLTVMYNPITQMVTLLDYPKTDQIDSILTNAHQEDLRTYNASSYAEYRENYLYAIYAASNYDSYRTKFANAWAAAEDEDREELYRTDGEEYLYGPWVNAEFCANWESWLSGTPGSTTTPDTSSGDATTDPDGDGTAMINTLTNWLFEPITAYAAGSTPKPYYDVYEYDVINNAQVNDAFRPSTPEEEYLLYAVENIVVPEGVDSIDVYGYVNNLTSEGEAYKGAETNRGNYTTYLAFGWDTDSRNMYTRSLGEDEDTEIVPGLFSGYYVDFDSDSEYEKFKRGNDAIKSVTMTSVKYLPDYAFDSCEQLWYVSLGADCADIGTVPFRGCYALSAVAGNDYYEADNGIIYSKNTDGSLTLEECFASRGKAGIVGQAAVSLANDPKLSQVSAIKPGAFEDCDVITSVDFGSNGTAGLTEIPDDCFKNCDKLQGVTLPITVNDIGSEAFVGSNQLTELTVYGKEVKISGTAFDDSAEKLVTTVRAYDDSAVVRYVKEYGTAYKLQLNTTPLGEQWKVTFLGPDYTLIEDLMDIDGNALDNPQYVEDGTRATTPQNPESTADWTFNKWVGMNNVEIDDRITEDTVFYAQGYSNNGMVNGQYVVEFYDSVDGKQIGPTQYIDPGKDAVAPAYPVHAGYTFDKWSDATTNIQSNKSILALYTVSGGVNSSGNTTNTSGNTTNISGNGTNTSGNTTSSSTSTTSSSNDTTSSSNASTSTTSSETAASLYTATVIGGSGSGSYTAGTSVVIQAIPPAGQTFSRWVTESEGVSFANATAANTTFTMPASNVTITAEYIAGTAPAATTTSTDGNGGSTDGGNTRVDITKPGISNKDLATANVNGSTDNFIIKITETDEATRAVSDALTNKYGSLDNILYYAMDITLWDATGTYQLTGDQVAGITVDITIPIPDALVAYGGNNMAGAVINSNQLENLNENFTTINGVPCIRFTATHFSPYTIYVDTGNLTEGMLDATPKTGDPIHPKWFLSVGLACLSIILFMKKDKVVKVKTA